MAEAWSAVPEWIRKAEADWAAASTLYSQNNEELHDAVVLHPWLPNRSSRSDLPQAGFQPITMDRLSASRN